MTKKNALWFLLFSFAVFCTGLLFIIWPVGVFNLIGYILGGLLLAAGIWHGVRFFSDKAGNTKFTADLLLGIFALILGIVMLSQPAEKRIFTPIVIGGFLLFCCVFSVKYALDSRSIQFRHWWVIIILSVLFAIIAAISIFIKFQSTLLLMRLVGSFAAVFGLTGLALGVMVVSRARSVAKMRTTPQSETVSIDINAAHAEEESTKKELPNE